MFKPVSLVVMLSLATLSVPALAQDRAHVQACKQHCAENCTGKGNYCHINCEARCEKYGGRH
jgi:hypothetical protein